MREERREGRTIRKKKERTEKGIEPGRRKKEKRKKEKKKE